MICLTWMQFAAVIVVGTIGGRLLKELVIFLWGRSH